MNLKRIAMLGCIMLIPTCAIFGPAGGFHHMIGFGWCVPYMVWSGEDVGRGLFDIDLGDETYAVAIDFGRLAINVGIWIAVLTAAMFVSRQASGSRHSSGPTETATQS